MIHSYSRLQNNTLFNRLKRNVSRDLPQSQRENQKNVSSCLTKFQGLKAFIVVLGSQSCDKIHDVLYPATMSLLAEHTESSISFCQRSRTWLEPYHCDGALMECNTTGKMICLATSKCPAHNGTTPPPMVAPLSNTASKEMKANPFTLVASQSSCFSCLTPSTLQPMTFM